MKYLAVGVLFLLFVMVLALHDGVIYINRYRLHKTKWKIIKWMAGILGGFLINSLLR